MLWKGEYMSSSLDKDERYLEEIMHNLEKMSKRINLLDERITNLLGIQKLSEDDLILERRIKKGVISKKIKNIEKTVMEHEEHCKFILNEFAELQKNVSILQKRFEKSKLDKNVLEKLK